MANHQLDFEFSVIICCYYEEQSIEEFYTRLDSALKNCGRSYEIIMVNDGSKDKTFDKLKDIYAKDSNVTTIINLFRNSGQLAAMTAGINQARGKHYIFIDSDLQLDPEELPVLLKEFDSGYDVVSGYRKIRIDSILRRVASKLANLIVKKVSGHTITDFGCTFKVYNGKLIRAFELGPHKLFQTAYIYSRAQTVKEVPITHHVRKYGKSGWTFKKLFSFHMDNVVGLSRRPFQWLSATCLFFAFLFFLRVLLSWVLPFSILKEITPGLILNVLIFILLCLLAVLAAVGEYVIRNFIYLQKYPFYIIREMFQKNDKGE